MLYTANFRGINPDSYEQIWLVVRNLKAMPKNPYGNIIHMPLLSPSQKLYSEFWAKKQTGDWDQLTFDNWYAPIFLSEMLKPEPLAKLRELAELSKTHDICLVCYCQNERMCHRYLLKQIIESINS